ncbi:MAG: tetratricopeptide repeat protein [Planctomycetota bacterium]
MIRPALAPIDRLIAEGKLDQAETQLRRLIARSPSDVSLVSTMATVLSGMGRRDESLLFHQRAAELAPDQPAPWLALGLALVQIHRHADALAPLERAASLAPAQPAATLALARAQVATGRSSAAIAQLESLLHLLPGDPEATLLLESLLSDRGQTGAAVSVLREAISRRHGDPILRAALCHRLLCASDATPSQIGAEHESLGRLLAPDIPGSTLLRDRQEDRRLKLALISPDLRGRPAAAFIEPIVELMGRKAFELHVFPLTAHRDATTDRLAKLADVWHPPQAILSTDSRPDLSALAASLAETKLDIAIDLAGYSPNSGLAALAHRIAPVQCTYGYPGTSGIPAVDLRLADSLTLPIHDTAIGTERIVRLDPCLFCFRPPADAPMPQRAWERRAVVFGCFASPARISTRSVELWAALLSKIPSARLVLKSKPYADPVVREFFTAAFSSRGVDPARLVLMGHSKDLSTHLSAYNGIDVALDTVPYNGTTTTCEALWMGVPVVTLRGDHHASRSGTSLLSAVGKGEWAAETPEAFVDVAASLVSDVEALAAARSKLRDQVRRSPLCDERTFVNRFQDALRAAWIRWCRTGSAGRG